MKVSATALMLKVFLMLMAHQMTQKNGIFHGQLHHKSERRYAVQEQ